MNIYMGQVLTINNLIDEHQNVARDLAIIEVFDLAIIEVF